MVLPIGPLMIEHRLIERMINLINKEVLRIEKENTVDIEFIQKATEFIRNYADAFHHGKEENILFRDLKTKQLKEDHKRIMNELIEEHKLGRKLTKTLINARIGYIKGNKESLTVIINTLKTLAEFYPKHIAKEDKRFFKPIMGYFSIDEKDQMLKEEEEFDKNFAHFLYNKIITELE
ncbi:MAG: hemerythrin domain-containing protein [Candidatus Thorarchaeota archaeon]